jgi:hypothetical protein
MKTLFKRALIIIPFLLISGCSSDSLLGILFSPPDCQIINIQKNTAPDFVITVQNTGSATAYNTVCQVTYKEGGIIVGHGTASFGTIGSGEASKAKVYSDILGNYDSYSTFLYWWDSQNDYYHN